jgi:hypothetical protein
MIGVDEAMVSILQVWLESYDGLLRYILDLLHQICGVLASCFQVLDDGGKQLFG